MKGLPTQISKLSPLTAQLQSLEKTHEKSLAIAQAVVLRVL